MSADSAGSRASPLPQVGEVLGGKYLLEKLIGRGGMGAVYAAKHVRLEHTVAIKVMLADAANHEARERFLREGRSAARIQSEHVVRVVDVDEGSGYPFMVLEFLEGEDLAQILERQGRLAPGIAVGYVLQALEGVHNAHIQNIVHRDLKPSNLYLARRPDGTTTVKVLDFGISKSTSASPLGQAPGQLTSTKAMLGSPLYMSPEQLRSSRTVDHRADIWAMGVILYELLTGALPFMGENLGELFAAILEQPPQPLRTRAPEVSAGLEAVVLKCLESQPDRRFQSAGELAKALVPYVDTLSPSQRNLVFPAVAGPPNSRANFASTPGARGGAPAVTGSSEQNSAAPRPVNQSQTANAWQKTGSGKTQRKSALPIVLGVAVAFSLALSVSVYFVYTWTHRLPATLATSAAPPERATSTAPSTSPQVSAAPPPVASIAPSTAPATPPSASVGEAPEVAKAAGTAKRPSTRNGPNVTPPKIDPKPPAETAKVNPSPAKPSPSAGAKTTQSTLETVR